MSQYLSAMVAAKLPLCSEGVASNGRDLSSANGSFGSKAADHDLPLSTQSCPSFGAAIGQKPTYIPA